MDNSNGNWGENVTFKVTCGSGFKVRSDTGCAPPIIIQPFHQHQVQQVPPKHPFVQHFLEHFWSLEPADRKCLKEGCRPFEHSAGCVQNTLVLDTDYLAEFRARAWKTGSNALGWGSPAEVPILPQALPNTDVPAWLLGPFGWCTLARCSQQLWDSPTSLVGQELHLLALEEEDTSLWCLMGT